MKKSYLSLISLILTLIILVSSFASCTTPTETDTEKSTDTVTETDSYSDETEATTVEAESETETDPVEVGPLLEGDHALLVENAYKLQNGVNAYYDSTIRNSFIFENLEMQLEYALDSNMLQHVTSLTNKKGNPYVENTMDVFVEMTDGSRYYGSQSHQSTKSNIARFGYYFYEMRLESQVFANNVETISQKKIKHISIERTNHCSKKVSDGILVVTNQFAAGDPYVVFGSNYTYNAAKYHFIDITLKADHATETYASLFVIAGDYTSFNATQCKGFNIINDGEFHTYRIPLYMITDYTGTLKGLRLDVSGSKAVYEISEVNLIEADFNDAPTTLSMNRSFNVYSDKMHHIIQIAATEKTTNVASVGMLTKIDAQTVAKLIVKDAKGTHDNLDGVDWKTAEYVGFDIKNAGIFGYILPYDGSGGTIEVSLTDGMYVIEQTATPKDNTINPSVKSTKNANDFFMGQRIYTDSSHTFDEFLNEAYCERNPLTDKNIVINEDSSTSATFAGYDALNGIYVFNTVGPANFNVSYYYEQNNHYRISFDINGDAYNRKTYFMTNTTSGSLESAVLLDENDVMLPVVMEVGKNFSEASGERNLYNLDDPTYGQAIFPMVVEAGSKNNSYTVLNLYQNWGDYPLKQLSWIQFHSPYYHLSTGVSETNCILPWSYTRDTRGLNTLPDFRPMSSPLWPNQPQHTSCGAHTWLIYTDSDNRRVVTENTLDVIDAYGPVYAEVAMDYLSSDGKIKVSYNHIEMPQTDENRTYYEMKYEVLEDITISNFVRNFEFYSVTDNDPTGVYKKVGYLNKDNECVVVAANSTSAVKEYVLGDNCPYFSFFDMENSTKDNGYSNLAFLVYDYKFIIGGKESDANFAILNYNNKVSVTLALDEVTLKAGDTFTINAILLPWGSQESNYNGEEPDANVREVRRNTLLNPLKATAVENCQVMESVFVPKIKTTNGTSAEFTLSGGNNNCAVRVYGFQKMTVPVIYEKVNGEWVKYDVSSADSPDNQDYSHKYDGYSIQYDGDGTFSYSFVVEMDNGAPRTFKVVADGTYEKWEKEIKEAEKPAQIPDPLVDPSSGYTLSKLNYAGNIDVFNGKTPAASFNCVDGVLLYQFGSTTIADASTSNRATVDGPYFVLSGWMIVEGGISKYVWSADDGKTWNDMEAYGRSLSSASTAMINGAISRAKNTFTFTDKDIKNGNFQGASPANPSGLAADLTEYIGSTVNILFAAVPVADEKTLVPFLYVAGVQVKAAEDGSDEDDTSSEAEKIVYNEYVKEGSGYSVSSLDYASCLDMLNGRGPNSTQKYSSRGGNSLKGVDTVAHNGNTFSNGKLVVTGWSVIDGGVSKYVWSIDGGKTWHNASPYNMSAIKSAGTAFFNGVYSRIGVTLDSSSAANAVYQGTVDLEDPTAVQGIEVDLSAYAGQTVNVIFAAVPSKNTETLCVLHYITGVTVIAE